MPCQFEMLQSRPIIIACKDPTFHWGILEFVVQIAGCQLNHAQITFPNFPLTDSSFGYWNRLGIADWTVQTYKMMKAFFKSLVDPKPSLLGPTIGSLRVAGLLLPKNPIARFLRLFIHANVSYLIITQFIELYIFRDDLGLLLTNLKLAMLSSTAFFKICSFIFFQKTWHDIIDYVTEADQFERDTQDDIRKEIIEKCTRYCRRATYFYWAIVLNTHLCVVGRSAVLYSKAEYKEEMRNGTAPFPHLFSSWTAFDKETSPGCWFLVTWHYFVAFNGTLLLAAYDAAVVVFIVFFEGKLDLMRERCKNLFGKGEGLSEGEVRANLRQLHSMHVELIKHCRMLNSVLSPVMFLYTIMCTLMLCSSLFQLASETQLVQKIFLAQYLMFGVAQLFIVCLPSNNCFSKSEEVVKGPYESEWWKSTVSIRQKKDVLLLCGQLRQTYTFTAGPFVALNLPTFVTILKGAYSYYTLLRD